MGWSVWVWGTHRGGMGGLWRNGRDRGYLQCSQEVYGAEGGMRGALGLGSPMECFPLVQRRGKGVCRLGVPPRTPWLRQRCLPHWHLALISWRCLVLAGFCRSRSTAGGFGVGCALSPLSKTPSAPPKTVPEAGSLLLPLIPVLARISATLRRAALKPCQRLSTPFPAHSCEGFVSPHPLLHGGALC